MYSKEKIGIALKVFHQTESVTETIRILDYPTRGQLYNWIEHENESPKIRKQLPVVGNPPEHPRNPPIEVKLDAIKRCFEQGDNVKDVSEDIGFSRASIYQWRKRYIKKGTLGLMNKKNISSGELIEGDDYKSPNDSSNNEIAEFKSKMLDMQMEIDILKETINVLKKTPASFKQLSATGRRQ